MCYIYMLYVHGAWRKYSTTLMHAPAVNSNNTADPNAKSSSESESEVLSVIREARVAIRYSGAATLLAAYMVLLLYLV